jgi:hypothetical protein
MEATRKVLYFSGKQEDKMIKRKVYQAKKSGLVSITIPGKTMKEWGIEGLKEVFIEKLSPGLFRFFATTEEINRLKINDEYLDKTPE